MTPLIDERFCAAWGLVGPDHLLEQAHPSLQAGRIFRPPAGPKRKPREDAWRDEL